MGDELVLGGGIQLSGFGSIESSEFLVVKKMVGNFVKKLNVEDINLKVKLKEVHKTEKNQKYEVHGVIDIGGKIKQSEMVDYNLFFALNKVLGKLK